MCMNVCVWEAYAAVIADEVLADRRDPGVRELAQARLRIVRVPGQHTSTRMRDTRARGSSTCAA